MNQRAQAKSEHLTRQMSRREDLFRDFILAASKVYGDALVTNDPQLPELVGLYAMISRMRVLCQPETVTAADMVMLATTETYFAPYKTVRELHDLIKNGPGVDPLKDFSEAARTELQGLVKL